MAIRNRRPSSALLVVLLNLITVISLGESRSDTNHVYSPCGDASVQKSDGFTFGIAFAASTAFTLNRTQLSPCDHRLSLSNANSQLAVFRPRVDQISLLTINTSSTFSPDNYGGYMVAFAGRRYAAVSRPAFVANGSYIVTSFTLVHEFRKGRLQNLFWKRDGCSSCAGNPRFVCLNNQDCAIRIGNCTSKGGREDCSIGIQLAFSGTDKHESVFNSWYEVENLRQYSLFGLYSNLRSSISGFF